MPVTAVVGAQWGDEGKGKIVDLLSGEADFVVRFGGGSNAGHTVMNEYGTFKLHSLPSGGFNPGTVNVIGTGTVVDFDSLTSELESLRQAGVPPVNLVVSDRAHIVMPYHKTLDRLKDDARREMRIGTTGQGVGPAYADKVDRTGIQVGELRDLSRLEQKLEAIVRQKNRQLKTFDHPGFEVEEVIRLVGTWQSAFASSVCDTIPLLARALQDDSHILLEGQLGVMRDLDWGIYPYVTSSTTFAGGGAPGAGIPPAAISDVLGVVKAYTSAVGEGPLPAELLGQEASNLRERGGEYGATTGRARRVGWLDAVALRYATSIGAFTRVAVTKLDVLDGVDPLRIVVKYRMPTKTVDVMPHPADIGTAEPIYEEMPGWSEATSHARKWKELPLNAQVFVSRISDITNAPISHVSVGPARSQTIHIREH